METRDVRTSRSPFSLVTLFRGRQLRRQQLSLQLINTEFQLNYSLLCVAYSRRSEAETRGL
jgi:hypothetical protein